MPAARKRAAAGGKANASVPSRKRSKRDATTSAQAEEGMGDSILQSANTGGVFDALQPFLEVCGTPNVFSAPSDDVKATLLQASKAVFENGVQMSSHDLPSGPITTLDYDGLDAEQIWSIISLRTDPLLKSLEARLKKLEAVGVQSTSRKNQNESDSEDGKVDNESDVEKGQHDGKSAEEKCFLEDEVEEEGSTDEEMESESDEGGDSTTGDDECNKPRRKNQGLNDDFFNIDEMERFADEGERLGMEEEVHDGSDEDDSEEDEDESGGKDWEEADDFDFSQFAGGGDDDEEANVLESIVERARRDTLARDETDEEDGKDSSATGMKYDDFFDAPKTKHEKEIVKKRKQIEQLEEIIVQPKPWQLSGEVSASQRPQGSLLAEDLEFSHSSAPPPVVTQETTLSLEEMIKKRIAEEVFDDVIRRKAPVDSTTTKRRKELDDEKSKLSLAEIYEKEYMEQAGHVEKVKSEEQKKEEQIAGLFSALCYKLDALTNFNFTPDPAMREMEVKINVPAISMEEATPTVNAIGGSALPVSGSSAMAPEEVYDKRKSQFAAREEVSQEERKALRAARKRANRKRKREAEADKRAVERLRVGGGNKYSKEKALRDLQLARDQGRNVEIGEATDTVNYSSSGAVFKKIQEEVQKEINEKAGRTAPGKKKKGKTADPAARSKKLKL